MKTTTIILWQVRRVARELEAERSVTSSRAPRLLFELQQTLVRLAMDRANRDLAPLPARRKSSANGDAACDHARATLLLMPEARLFAVHVADKIQSRLGHIYRAVDDEFLEILLTGSESDDNETAKKSEAVLMQAAAVFDINECDLCWLPAEQCETYTVELIKVVAHWSGAFEDEPAYAEESHFCLLKWANRTLCNQLCENGRRSVDECLRWWKADERWPSVHKIIRGLFSVPASSAAAERLFSNASSIEGTNRSRLDTDVMGKLLTIKAYCKQQLSEPSTMLGKPSTLSNAAQLLQQNWHDIAAKIEEKKQ